MTRPSLDVQVGDLAREIIWDARDLFRSRQHDNHTRASDLIHKLKAQILALFPEGRSEQDRLTEDEARERLRALIGASSVLAWATANGLTGQQVDSFLRGDRPLEPKLATAMGLRRVYVYEPMEATNV